VAFAGRDNLVWAGGSGAATRMMVLDVEAAGANDPRFVDVGVAPSVGALLAVACDRADAVFTCAQYVAPTIYQRRTEISRNDPVAASAGAPFGPVWSHDMGLISNGPAALATDDAGELVVAAAWDNATSKVHVHWLDATTGALLEAVVVTGAALSEIRVSGDGSRVLLAAGLDLYVFDARGRELHHSPLLSATHALAISADGGTLVVGGIGRLVVLEQLADVYSPVFEVLAPGNHIATCADVSAAGETIAVGWWNYANGVDLTLEVWDGIQFTLLLSLDQRGLAGGVQNLPEVARVTPDGRRIAFGCWGNGTATPEVVLLDRDEQAPILALDLPGSCRALDLDDSGTRVVVAYKDAHVNLFAATGGIRLYDTGERELQQLAPAEVGGAVPLAAKHENASAAFFLVGDPAPPMVIPGVQGALLLDRHTLSVYPVPADASGRADFLLPIPASPVMIGVHLAVQGAFRVGPSLVLTHGFLAPLVLDL